MAILKAHARWAAVGGAIAVALMGGLFGSLFGSHPPAASTSPAPAAAPAPADYPSVIGADGTVVSIEGDVMMLAGVVGVTEVVTTPATQYFPYMSATTGASSLVKVGATVEVIGQLNKARKLIARDITLTGTPAGGALTPDHLTIRWGTDRPGVTPPP